MKVIHVVKRNIVYVDIICLESDTCERDLKTTKKVNGNLIDNTEIIK